nr:uncharacterized protein LOC120974851 [Aegilops tauschii subsp. strangulata]
MCPTHLCLCTTRKAMVTLLPMFSAWTDDAALGMTHGCLRLCRLGTLEHMGGGEGWEVCRIRRQGRRSRWWSRIQRTTGDQMLLFSGTLCSFLVNGAAAAAHWF